MCERQKNFGAGNDLVLGSEFDRAHQLFFLKYIWTILNDPGCNSGGKI